MLEKVVKKMHSRGVSMYLLTLTHLGTLRLNYTWILKIFKLKCGKKSSDWSLAVVRLVIGFQTAQGLTSPLTLLDYLDYFVLK